MDPRVAHVEAVDRNRGKQELVDSLSLDQRRVRGVSIDPWRVDKEKKEVNVEHAGFDFQTVPRMYDYNITDILRALTRKSTPVRTMNEIVKNKVKQLCR